ncbi:MAG: hypothetical protein HFG80_09265 [Eubacterium sp.]|nr:hypothetical protein [Eubacterium sp.]
MDKYEYKLKMDQIKSLIGSGSYQTASEIADDINWKKVRNINTLVQIGDLYEKAGKYEDSIDVLLMAFDRSPIGRMIVYRLACVSLKAGNIDEAEEYYQEFVEIAPQDPLKYIIKYKISKAKKEPVTEQVAILEQYKEEEYSEEWAFELAYLYHKAAMVEQCIEACDELVLWFGDGIYVEKALELKMLYQPLNKHQEEKYRQLKQNRSGIVEVSPTDVLESGEIVHEAVQIPTVGTNTGRFNTMNLQAELAKSMQQIMEATERETVTNTMDSIKKMVEEIPYLQLSREEEEKQEEQMAGIETDEEIDGSLNINFREILQEDLDGQMRLNVPNHAHKEPQITGQMCIDDILEEWEKTKRAAEAAMENARQRKLESAKRRALQQTGNLMDKLQDVIPMSNYEEMPPANKITDYGKIPAAESLPDYAEAPAAEPQPDYEEAPAADKITDYEEPSAAAPAEHMDSKAAPKINRGYDEEYFKTAVSDVLEEEIMQLRRAGEKIDSILRQPKNKLPDPTVELPNLDAFVIHEAKKEQDRQQQEANALAEALAVIRGGDKPQEAAAEIAQPGAEEIMPEIAEPELEEELPVIAELNLKEEVAAVTKSVPKERLPIIADPEILTDEDIPEIAEPEEEYDYYEQTELTEEQKQIFSYFVPIGGMEKQICQVLVGASKRMRMATNSASGNIIIQGYAGSGKTQMASNLLKALQQKTGRMLGTPGRIYAESLNHKDLVSIMKKVKGGCLIIEKAGELTKETATKLSLLMEQDTGGLLVILEDTRAGIDRVLRLDASFAKKFTEKINIPIFTSDELVAFAKVYAKEEECEIDELGILALYRRIGNIQRLDQATTLVEVKDIIDAAIESAERGGLKRSLGNFFSKRKNTGDYTVLMEQDFED